jgi:hypothetical protein
MNSAERKEGRYQRRKAERERKRQQFYYQYNDFSLLTDPDHLYEAYRKSKKGVTWKASVQRYEMNVLVNIAETIRKLNTGVSVSHGFVEFDLMERGRLRHIKSVHISERVVQKCMCDQILVPVLSRSLIYDNGASLKNKGLHFSIGRFKTHLAQFYREHGNNGYCLSIDFSKYFDSIDHAILLKNIEKVLPNPQIMKVLKDFILPFGDGVSLGLGSQVSQISAIYYANSVDHIVKRKLHFHGYGRYMDDSYLIHKDRDYLLYCLSEIKKVCETLKIKVNMKKTKIVKLKDGVKFLKGIYCLTETGKIIARADPDSRKRMSRKLRKFKKLVDMGKMNFHDAYTAYQSWRGNYIKRFNAYHTVERMDGLYNRLFIA